MNISSRVVVHSPISVHRQAKRHSNITQIDSSKGLIFSKTHVTTSQIKSHPIPFSSLDFQPLYRTFTTQTTQTNPYFSFYNLDNSFSPWLLPYFPPQRLYSTTSTKSPMDRYQAMVEKGQVKEDPIQRKALEDIEHLFHQLCSYKPPRISLEELQEQMKIENDPSVSSSKNTSNNAENNKSWLSSLFNLAKNQEPKSQQKVVSQSTPRGLYLHGGVGCGKTFLMDLLYESIPHQHKKRIHFNSFMLNFHSEMHEKRKNLPEIQDYVPLVVHELIEQAHVICFDEFQVTDVADAMILKRIFQALINSGVVIIATSNRPPDDLYEDGLNRELFIPFIHYLKERVNVFHLDSPHDYRLSGSMTDRVYLTPLNQNTKNNIDKLFNYLTHNQEVGEETLKVIGREVKVPCAARGVARFTFYELCEHYLGPADYIAIAQRYHTLFITDVPTLTVESHQRNFVRRFILLIDEMYNHHVKVIISAERPPKDLLDLSASTLTSHKEEYSRSNAKGVDEVFAFDRTVSRLLEMQSAEYLELPHVIHSDVTHEALRDTPIDTLKDNNEN